MSRIPSSLPSFALFGLSLLAAISTLTIAAPTSFVHGHHGHHSAIQAAQHAKYLSKRAVIPRQEEQNCTEEEQGDLDPVVASGWYPAWEKAKMPVANIPWTKFNQLTFAFALVLDDGTLSLGGEEETLREFSKTAKANDVYPYVSLGGYTGSRFFSPAVATPQNRTAFVKEIVKMATEYELAGIDFDWEYPGGLGLECNMHNPADTANFLALLRELKQDPVGKTLSLTAATHIRPFLDANGTPSTDVSSFGEVFDQIAIMAYDIHGAWSDEVGANAPLRSGSCPAGRDGSVETAVDAWVSAGFPASKLVLGVAAYGRAFHPTSPVLDSNGLITTVNPPHDKASIPFGENETEATDFGNDVCGNPGTPSGVFSFNALITSGLLNSEGTASSGPTIHQLYDNCTETPFIYDSAKNTMISYDDPRSMAAKGSFIVSKGMLGYAMWHIVGDSRDNLLSDALFESMGIVPVPDGAEAEAPEQEGEEEEDCEAY